METGLKINNIDFSDDVDELTFSIEHNDRSPEYLWLNVHKKNLEGHSAYDVDKTITLSASQMKALGKALVFAGEYVEGLYSKDGYNF